MDINSVREMESDSKRILVVDGKKTRRHTLAEELNRLIPLFKTIGVQKVILFGSHVLGTERSSSDLDLLIVMETNLKFLDRIDYCLQILNPRIAVDLLVYTPSELQELEHTRPFIRQILQSGRVIYESNSA